MRDHLVTQGPTDGELVAALADLDARAAQEALDETGTKQALLRLSERALERDLTRVREDSRNDERAAGTGLAKIREAIASGSLSG